jgi:carbon starvation protein
VLFLFVVFFVVALFMGAFVVIVAALLDQVPGAVIPVFGLIFIAVGMGWALYRMKMRLSIASIIGIVVMAISIYAGLKIPIDGISQVAWIPVLLVYSVTASILPVWILLQPRDYLNSFQLYAGLGVLIVGLFVAAPVIEAPVARGVLGEIEGLPSVFPIMFMIVACGAISGFHSLVSSGTTARQINNEADVRFVTYGGMLTEGLFAVVALLTCTAGIALADWNNLYASYPAVAANPMPIFLQGGVNFLGKLGIGAGMATLFLTVLAVGFAMTTLDTATRLLRFNIEEIAATLRMPFISKNRYIAAFIAIASIAFFVVVSAIGQTKAGVIRAQDNPLWPIAGMSNQLLAALGLLTASVYFYKVRRPAVFTLIPMILMLALTLWAAGQTILQQLLPPAGVAPNYGILIVALALFVMGVWLAAEGIIKALQLRRANQAAPAGGAVTTEVAEVE